MPIGTDVPDLRIRGVYPRGLIEATPPRPDGWHEIAEGIRGVYPRGLIEAMCPRH